MLKELFKRVLEVKMVEGEGTPSLSIELFDAGLVYELSKSELIALLKESIYLLRDESGDEIENKLIENIVYWNEELFEE